MTDLTKAIAELRQLNMMSAPKDDEQSFMATIWRAVVSGDLIPATERDAAVAAALEEAAERFPDGRQLWPPHAIRKAIRALINQPQADALARVRAEAYQRVLTAIAELPTPKDEAIMVGHENAYRAVERIADHDARIRAAIGGVE